GSFTRANAAVSDTFQSRQRKDGTFASLGMLATDSRAQIMRFSSAARRHLKRLTSAELGRLKKCPSANCGWIFLDTTRNRTRRWCDMKVCGNRAKARAVDGDATLGVRKPGDRIPTPRESVWQEPGKRFNGIRTRV